MKVFSDHDYQQLISDILRATDATGDPEAEADLVTTLVEYGIYSRSGHDAIESDAQPIVVTLDDGWTVNGLWWLSDHPDASARVVTTIRGDQRRTSQVGNLNPEDLASMMLAELGMAERAQKAA